MSQGEETAKPFLASAGSHTQGTAAYKCLASEAAVSEDQKLKKNKLKDLPNEIQEKGYVCHLAILGCVEGFGQWI